MDKQGYQSVESSLYTLSASEEGLKNMSRPLNTLIEAAKKVSPSAEHREQQRRSFAYGNTKFENDRITREMVDRQAEQLARESDDGSRGTKAR
jgi:hypothetical protein